MAYRVVQWSTGGVGTQALRALVCSHDFELVGVYTHTEARLGRDAGDIAGLAIETGVRATSDVDALLALRPACVVYTSTGETRPKQAVNEIARILESGANVVSSSMMNLDLSARRAPPSDRETGRGLRARGHPRSSPAGSTPASAVTPCRWPRCRSARAST